MCERGDKFLRSIWFLQSNNPTVISPEEVQYRICMASSHNGLGLPACHRFFFYNWWVNEVLLLTKKPTSVQDNFIFNKEPKPEPQQQHKTQLRKIKGYINCLAICHPPYLHWWLNSDLHLSFLGPAKLIFRIVTRVKSLMRDMKWLRQYKM
jgi:hypothetical protein